MLTDNLRLIGERLYAIRKKRGLTQVEVAEAAGLSERTYPEIERGIVNMRILTFMRICDALRVSPDEVLVEEHERLRARESDVLRRLDACSLREKETAMKLLDIYLQSIEEK